MDSNETFTLNEVGGKWRWLCGQCDGRSRNFPTGQQAQDDFYARHSPCPNGVAPNVGCAVLHTDSQGNTIPCPGDHPDPPSMATLVQRPPIRLYEVRTVHGEAYRAEGDVIESGDGWFTLWAEDFTLALRVPEADIRAVRQVSPDEEVES